MEGTPTPCPVWAQGGRILNQGTQKAKVETAQDLANPLNQLFNLGLFP